jgi:tetratricopeptide (TPR) repeat protein
MTPASALLSADCQWTTDDPAAVVQSCTAQLSVKKAPAAWMYFNRGLAFKVLGKLDEAHRDYSKAIELDRHSQRRTPTAAMFESSATTSAVPWPISERRLRSTQTTT